MKFKLLFIFTLVFSGLPLCAITQELLNEQLTDAVKMGNIEQVESCLLHGANPNIRIQVGGRDKTPLIFATEGGNAYIIKLLLDHHADVNAQDSIKETSLMKAAKKGDIDIAKLLLKHKADVNISSCGDYTALMIAAENGHTKIIRLLLTHKVNVDARDNWGRTALMFAAENDHTKIIRLLLTHNANVNIYNFFGQTALAWGSFSGFSQVVNILLKHNANIIYQPKNYIKTPLKYAVKGNKAKIVELLLKHINHILDQTDDPEICQKWDQYVLDTLNEIEKEWRYGSYPIDTINAFRMLLHHADKLPLSRKKLESLTAKKLGKRRTGEEAFRKTIQHLRTHAF